MDLEVLLIDFDYQAASTRSFNPPELERTVYDCVVKSLPVSEAVLRAGDAKDWADMKMGEDNNKIRGEKGRREKNNELKEQRK